MAPHVVVEQEVDLSKHIFNEVLNYNSRTGLGSCELHRIKDSLMQEGIFFDNRDLSLAVNDLISRGYIRLELFRISDDEHYQVALELTGKTARLFS